LAISSNREAALKTRDIPTLTNPHLPLNNNGSNPPLSAIAKTPNVYADFGALLLNLVDLIFIYSK
jgi:hypothetical protein